ncbi:MAG: hypothetical protein V4773_00365 [Verrucomicrobiota bacterium]
MRRFASLFVLILPVLAYAQAPSAGVAQFGTDRFVEYAPGDLPIVLTSPHGGDLTPKTIPDRTVGVTDRDFNSLALARAIVDALQKATGQRPHLIASHLHRRKLDPNREIKEAAAGDPAAERTWREFHAFIEAATRGAAKRHGFAFLIDIHGHAHPQPRLELGYGLNGVQLNQSDAAFDKSDFATLSSLRDLHARLGGSGADLIRGPRSLGTLFTERGIRAVPSAKEPGPGPGPFFSGGYIVHTHAGAPATARIDGVQFEAWRIGVRDTEENRARFAAVTAEVLAIFLRERYNYVFPKPAGAGKP